MQPSFIQTACWGLRFGRGVTTGVQVCKMSTKLTPQEAHKKLQETGSAVYLDVRMPAEFADGHVPAAVNVPVTAGQMVPIPTFVADVANSVPGGIPLVVGCKSGRRSELAVRLLGEAGFEPELFELDGGLDAWLKCSDLPVEQ